MFEDLFSFRDKYKEDKEKKECKTNILMLKIHWTCNQEWFVSDDSYDGAPDAGEQRVGHDKKLSVALAEYIRHDLGEEDEAYLIHKSEFYKEWD